MELRKLAVDLAGGIERMVFQAVLVVHDDLRIPLRKVEAPSLSSLTSRQGRGTRLPRDVDDERIAGRERSRQPPMRDRRIGGVRIVRRAPLSHHRRRRDPLEGRVGILPVLKAYTLLRGIGRGPTPA